MRLLGFCLSWRCFALLRFALLFVLHLCAWLFVSLSLIGILPCFALIHFSLLFIAALCCAWLCFVSAVASHCPPKQANDPTAQRPEGRPAGTTEPPNGPTGQRANGPNGPNVPSIPLIKFKLGQPFLLIIAEHDTAESARKSAAERLPLFSLREQ